MSPIQKELIDKVHPSLARMGFILWALEITGLGRKKTIRIYIDRELSPVTVDDCERVSRQVSALLDVEDPMRSAYTLEVSSPGIDRLLVTKSHYVQFVGNNVEVRMRITLDGRRNFSGLLCGVEDGCAVIRSGENEYVLPIEQIERGRVSAGLEKSFQE